MGRERGALCGDGSRLDGARGRCGELGTWVVPAGMRAAESDNRGGAGGTSCSTSPVIDMENTVSEQRNSAFAVGARRNTETASLALILRKTDNLDAVKAW